MVSAHWHFYKKGSGHGAHDGGGVQWGRLEYQWGKHTSGFKLNCECSSCVRVRTEVVHVSITWKRRGQFLGLAVMHGT